MVTIVIIETKYVDLLLFTYQLYFHLPYLFSLSDLSSSWVFPLLSFVTLFTIFVIVVCYPTYIRTMKKPINLNLLACCYCFMYLVFVILYFCCALLRALKTKVNHQLF